MSPVRVGDSWLIFIRRLFMCEFNLKSEISRFCFPGRHFPVSMFWSALSKFLEQLLKFFLEYQVKECIRALWHRSHGKEKKQLIEFLQEIMYANWLFSSFERRFVHSVGDNLQSYLPKKKRANLSLAFSIYLRVLGNLLCSNLTNSQKNS